MNFILPASTLRPVWDAVCAPAEPPRPAIASRVVDDVVRRGWAPSCMIEDLIQAQGCRAWTLGGLATCDLFSVPHQAVGRRPGAKASVSLGFQEVRVADLALMLMERFGFPVDPGSLVERLLPIIRRQAVVTSAELHVLWFAQERHRMPPVSMAVNDTGQGAWVDEALVLQTRYRAELWSEGNEPVRLTVTKPKRGALRAAA